MSNSKKQPLEVIQLYYNNREKRRSRHGLCFWRWINAYNLNLILKGSYVKTQKLMKELAEEGKIEIKPMPGGNNFYSLIELPGHRIEGDYFIEL